MLPNAAKTCKNCVWQAKIRAAVVCRLNPPQVSVHFMPGPPTLQSKGQPTIQQVEVNCWPQVSDDDYCSHFASPAPPVYFEDRVSLFAKCDTVTE
jgi:hypothetical protein